MIAQEEKKRYSNKEGDVEYDNRIQMPALREGAGG